MHRSSPDFHRWDRKEARPPAHGRRHCNPDMVQRPPPEAVAITERLADNASGNDTPVGPRLGGSVEYSLGGFPIDIAVPAREAPRVRDIHVRRHVLAGMNGKGLADNGPRTPVPVLGSLRTSRDERRPRLLNRDGDHRRLAIPPSTSTLPPATRRSAGPPVPPAPPPAAAARPCCPRSGRCRRPACRAAKRAGSPAASAPGRRGDGPP